MCGTQYRNLFDAPQMSRADHDPQGYIDGLNWSLIEGGCFSISNGQPCKRHVMQEWAAPRIVASWVLGT